MFHIVEFPIACTCEELQQTADRQYHELLNMDEVIRILQSLSGMEEVVEMLKQKREILELQRQSFLELVQGLQELRWCYERTEQRICGNKEAQIRE